jgi:3'-phosphoadenosine 5'-phosphosulfate sulfotransferase (PAPS reductase)/FAD synthetase
MKLKPNSEKALDAWLGPQTWHTNHDLDMERWYSFVDQYQRDHGFQINEPELQKLIENKLSEQIGKKFNNKDLRQTIRERITLAYKILDFLKYTGR